MLKLKSQFSQMSDTRFNLRIFKTSKFKGSRYKKRTYHAISNKSSFILNIDSKHNNLTFFQHMSTDFK